MKSETFFIAQVGRTVGLHGDLKLNLHTDFPEQFKPGAIFVSDRGDLPVEAYNPTRGIVRFIGYASMESATSALVFSRVLKSLVLVSFLALSIEA